MSRTRRGLAALLAATVAAAAAALLLGAVAVVTTTGVSMNPEYHEGDLVIVAAADDYRIGQIAAYRDRVHELVVLHRVIGRTPAGYVLRGDNNQSVDAVQPQPADMIGRAVLHVPGAGTWLRRLMHPAVLGSLVFLLLTAGGTAVRSRRKKRRVAVSKHAVLVSRTRGGLADLPPVPRMLAVALGSIFVAALTLSVASFSAPLSERVTDVGADATSVMTFRYGAAVPRSAAYDGVRVDSPDPVFRALANLVDVHLSYEGAPGTIEVTADLSAASGWHTTVPLLDATSFDSAPFATRVRLDLTALEARAAAAAAVTKMPIADVALRVRSTVRSPDAPPFVSNLALTLTPAQLRLAGDPSSLTEQATTTGVSRLRTVPATIGWRSAELTVADARRLSLLVAVAALLVAAAMTLAARRSTPMSEAERICRKYAAQLVAVEPMRSVSGRPTVDVADFGTLLRLAARYDLLVLHWTRSGTTTFVAQDVGATYRYRAASSLEPRVGGAPEPRTDVGAATHQA